MITQKPAWRCLTNPTNFVATFRFTDSKYTAIKCQLCDGKGKRKVTDFYSKVEFSGICIYCQGIGKISKRAKR